MVDAFSKYAWAVPLKKKTGKEVTDTFTKIIKQGRKPQKLQTDDGKEFYNKTFQAWLTAQGIHHFSTHGDAKASIAKRCIRTLKSKLYYYFTAANALKYTDVLPKLLYQYNHIFHRSIRTAPVKVNEKNKNQIRDSL